MKRLHALTVLLCGCGAALAQQDTPGLGAQDGALRPARLNAIVSSAALNNVNLNDVRPAIKIWFDIVAERRGLLLDSKVDIAGSVTQIRERLQSHSVDVLVLAAADYLELENGHMIVPILTHSLGGPAGAFYSYVLLVKPSSGVTSLAGLRGKNILVSSRGGSNTGIAWIDVLLGKEKLGRAAAFFASMKVPDKAQACILPVFFGTVDACVVDEINLNVAREMNPQLGQLQELARSRSMIGSVIAMPVEPRPYQKELIDTILSLHGDPRGRQLLLVFKTERIVRIQPGDLDSARELWTNYYRLPGSQPNRPPVGTTQAESNLADRGKEKH
jgi:ABC-type phosphate/phosphonate transport system substrate-binding protein